jgi:hypothetical protein
MRQMITSDVEMMTNYLSCFDLTVMLVATRLEVKDFHAKARIA